MLIETKTGGGLGSVLKRSFLGGESLFVNDMVATQPNSQVTVAPALPGDIAPVEDVLEPGHTTRAIGDEPSTGIFVHLAEAERA